MKKLLSTTLILTMIISMCACGAKKEATSSEETASNVEALNSETTDTVDASKKSEDSDAEKADNPHQPVVIGELTYINADVDQVKKYEVARLINLYAKEETGSVSFDQKHDHAKIADLTEEDLQALLDGVDVKMYDSLTSMIMALQAGDINLMTLYDSVANYICAKNSDLEVKETYVYDYDEMAYEDDSIKEMTRGITSDEFTFMMLEGNEALRDEFNSAIADMKKDGTLTRLTKEFITEVDFSADTPSSPDFESFDGADTVKVGVTGDLPPFDYMTESGEPEGFNRAILAEIGKRIGKNIELVSIDSASRALALSSEKIDVVFWTRSQARNGNRNRASDDASAGSSRKERTHEEQVERIIEHGGTPENAEIVVTARELARTLSDNIRPRKLDSPDGTINTEYFYTAPIVHVGKK